MMYKLHILIKKTQWAHVATTQKLTRVATALAAVENRRLPWILLVLSMLTYAMVMSIQSVLRYSTFNATAFDLGNMDQVIWNTLHGHLFMLTNQGQDWYGPPIRLAIHFEPIILPLSLLYLLHADPRTLLIFQTLALATGALPVFLIARKHLPQWPLLAAVMAMAYLLMPALIGVNIFDFHALSLATPLLLYAVLALEHKRYGWFLLACIFAAACKEDVPLAIAAFGILVLWKYKLPRLGIGLFIGGILWSLVAFSIIKHYFPGSQSNNFWYRYQELGATPGDAIVNILLHPWILIVTFVTMDRIYYLASLLRNTGFLSLLAPEWLIPALPSLAINLLSTDPLIYSGVYHYNALIIPFIMLSAIHGTKRAFNIWQGWRGEYLVEAEKAQTVPGYLRFLQPRIAALKHTGTRYWQRFRESMIPLAKSVPLPRLQRVALGWIIAMSLLNLVIMSIPLRWVNWADHWSGSREQHIQQVLNLIPPDATVSASDDLNPHLSEREYITVFPQITYDRQNGTKGIVQYVVVDLNDVFPENKVSTVKEVNQLLGSNQFRTVSRAEGVILLIRNSP